MRKGCGGGGRLRDSGRGEAEINATKFTLYYLLRKPVAKDLSENPAGQIMSVGTDDNVEMCDTAEIVTFECC